MSKEGGCPGLMTLDQYDNPDLKGKKLLKKLKGSNNKYNIDDVVMLTEGLNHILDEHRQDFIKKEIKE